MAAENLALVIWSFYESNDDFICFFSEEDIGDSLVEALVDS